MDIDKVKELHKIYKQELSETDSASDSDSDSGSGSELVIKQQHSKKENNTMYDELSQLSGLYSYIKDKKIT